VIAGIRHLHPAAAMVLVLQACAVERPVARPGGDEGMVVYQVGRLSFQAPQAWEASGGPAAVRAESRDGSAFLDVRSLDRRFPGERECLAQADESLAQGAADLANVRRHSTTLAGRRAVAQEADRGNWHGWAYAVCDGGTQYRLFLTGVSPVSGEALAALRALLASAWIGGRR
jgi:hypothetical protein